MKIAEKMKMKKVLMTLVLLPLMALADTETVDGIAWTYTVSAGEASVGNGWDSAIPSDTSGAITIPSNLGGCPVTDIGSFAFAELYDLESVKIPNTVKSIGEGSFFACSFLDGVEIPDSVEIIGAGAFKDCSWMQTIYIGNGLKWIETDAFKGCSNLQKIMLPEGLESIGNEAFAGCWRMQSVSLPMSVQEVDSSAFSGCSSLTGVTTPTHRGTMSDWFTPVCGQIREVTIPYSESMIAVNMFSNCISLVKVSFDRTPTSGAWQGVTEIGNGAFYNCRSLVDIELPHSLVRIGRQAFRNCTALPAISLPAGVQQIGEYAFCSCSSLKDLALSESLTAIPDYAFYGCDNLDSFTVPESVNYLGSRFVGCGNSWQGTSAVYYLGNAPTYAEDAYAASRSDLKSYVILGTRGWDGRVSSRDIPQSWPVANSCSRGILTWSPIPFDVTFDACGGSFANDGSSSYACQQITYTNYALPPYYPKREGRVFDGWWTERTGGTRVTASTRVLLAKAHTLYAHWIAGGDVFVRFNATGGTVSPESGIYQTGKLYGGLPVPTREYWDFAGWWTEVSGGTQIHPDSEVPAADVELFARWNPARYKIVFHSAVSRYSWEDEETYTQEFTYGETVTLRENPFTSYGLTFAGWATERDGLPVYADRKTLTEITSIHDGVIDLYAVWVGDQYAIRFDSNGGYGVMPNQACFIGVYQQLSSNLFTRAGYVFDGWSRTKTGRREYTDMKSVINLSTIKNDTVVLYAVWKEIKYYTITFDARGGECDEDSRKVREGEVIGELPVTTRVGYVIRCWTTGSSGGMVLDPGSVISYSRTYYAQWERAERIRISFDANGGRIGDHVKETHVGNFTVLGKLIPTATWTGYVFLGWFTEQEGGVQVSESTEVSADVTFYAHWRLLNQPVSVVFDPQGGQCSKTNVTGISGKAIGALPTPTRSKYKFLGWYTAAEGGTRISSAMKVTADVTYYAHWTYDGSATVVVNVGSGCAGMGTVTGGKTAKAGTKVTLKATATAGYVFAGWYRDAAGEEPVEDGTDYRSPSYAYVVGEDDATFYAKFIPVAEDWVSVWCQSQDEYVRGGEIAPLVVEVYSESLATVKVTGLPTGLKFTAKPLTLKATNYRAAVDLPANTIYGTPTKSGIYTATITATTAGKKSETYKVDLVVRGAGEYLVDVMGIDGADYPTNGSDTQHAIKWGKMSGYGVFAPGKTATLKATANKGYVFAGWFSDVACVCEGGEEDDGCIYTPAKGTVDYRSTSFPVKVGYEDLLYYARFVRAEDDDKLWANVEDAYYLNGQWSLKLDIESMSLPTVTVKGLPSGLKFNSKTLTISGTPTKPGTYPITLSLKNKTITKAKTQNFTLYVANIESPYLAGVDYSSDAYPCSVGSDVRFDLGACVRGGYSISAVSGLPKGISYNKATGMIEGCPTQDGAYTVAIALKNGRLSSNATLTMNVSWIEENFSLRLYRYVAVLESLSVRQYGDGLSFEKPQGTLPSGINVSVDTQRNVMTIEGIPTSEGTFCMNYTLNVQKGGKKTPCAKIVLQIEVVDPTQVGTGKDGAALNDSCEKLRTFEDLMIFANDDELGEDNAKRLLGTLRLTLPATGKASAKFLCESGTVSFAAKSWDKIDLEDGSLKTTLVGTTKIFKDWMLEVAADPDGGVRLWMSSPSATYNSLYFGKEPWSKTHSAADYSGYYTVTLAPATDDAGEPIVTGTGRAYAPLGSGYLSLKETSPWKADFGTVTWAGRLPNGRTMSGRGVLTEVSEKTAWLPMVNFSTKDKFAGVVELERGAAAAEPGAACWESVSTPTWDAATVRTWWRHTEAVPKTDKNEFTVRYEPYGGIYSKYDLNCCCEMMGAGSTISLTIDVPASFVSDYYGKFEAVDSIDVKISSQSDIRVDSMGGRNNITLSHDRSTGIVSGRFDLHYTDAKTLTNKKLMAEYAGVIQLGCGDKCGCGISLPFVKGFWCVTDRIGYQKDEVSGAFKKWLPSKRGGAFTIELEE